VDQLRVAVEIGPKGKKVVAVAPDWPGLSRGAATEQAALDRLLAYVPRYAPIAKLAGMDAAFAHPCAVDVIERYPGTGSTDFWGISFAFSTTDHQAISRDELERELTLMQACWAFFDGVRSRVSAEMQRGPRGGGRDRDHIVRHTLGTETDWAKGIGVHSSVDELLTEDGLKAHRAAYLRGDPNAALPGQDGPQMAPALPHPPHRLSHSRSRLGDGR
jgi:hypothetical protein